MNAVAESWDDVTLSVTAAVIGLASWLSALWSLASSIANIGKAGTGLRLVGLFGNVR